MYSMLLSTLTTLLLMNSKCFNYFGPDSYKVLYLLGRVQNLKADSNLDRTIGGRDRRPLIRLQSIFMVATCSYGSPRWGLSLTKYTVTKINATAYCI